MTPAAEAGFHDDREGKLGQGGVVVVDVRRLGVVNARACEAKRCHQLVVRRQERTRRVQDSYREPLELAEIPDTALDTIEARKQSDTSQHGVASANTRRHIRTGDDLRSHAIPGERGRELLVGPGPLLSGDYESHRA